MKNGKPDRLLLISILLAAAIVAGAIVFVSLRQGPPADPSLAPYREQVIIQQSLRACTQGDSCIVVDTTCSFCCKYVAINAKHEKLFNELFDSECQRYNGAVCECFDLGSYPACVNGKCELVKWDEGKKP